MIPIFLFILGLVFGSFASVIIHRLHTREKGLLAGRSKCPYCSKHLRSRDLIPVLSYVINKFKCRFCKEPIAFRYPLLELSMGGLFMLTGLLVGINTPWHLAFYLLMSFVFVILVFYDFLFKEVPDVISLPFAGVAFCFSVLSGLHSLSSLLIGIVIPVLFFGALFFGSQGRWIGGGDLRIGVIMGALVGWPLVLVALFLGYLSGAVYSLSGLALGVFKRKSQIPFAPFLLLGTYLALFWGKNILDWYFFYI
jgi:prepilin signal peptidase PulO-like enzyme (type II secretory pathway)